MEAYGLRNKYLKQADPLLESTEPPPSTFFPSLQRRAYYSLSPPEPVLKK
jgi:hypothetical protein